MREDGVITFDGDGWSRRPTRHRALGVKRRNLKRYAVRLPRTSDPDGVLEFLWERMRETQDPGWTMTHGDVRDGVVHLVLEYRGRGGVPSDIRKILGRKIRGMRFHDDDCLVERKHSEDLPE